MEIRITSFPSKPCWTGPRRRNCRWLWFRVPSISSTVGCIYSNALSRIGVGFEERDEERQDMCRRGLLFLHSNRIVTVSPSWFPLPCPSPCPSPMWERGSKHHYAGRFRFVGASTYASARYMQLSIIERKSSKKPIALERFGIFL